MPKRFSSVVGRSFGDGVRDAIHSAGLTQAKAAELVDWEQAKVSDLVNGKGGVTEVELAMLLGLCGVKPDEARRLLTLYKESREKGYLEFAVDGVLNPQRTLMDQQRHANESRRDERDDEECCATGHLAPIRRVMCGRSG